MMVSASALFGWFAGWLIFWAHLAVFSGNVWLIVAGGVAVIFLGPLLLSLLPSVLHPWLHRGPVVILDAEGVTDLRKKSANRSIAWSDVGQVQLGSGETSSCLAFEFRRPNREKQDGAVVGGLAVFLNRARLLSDWNISLRMLSCSKQEVLKAATRLHQQSVRRQVVERNKGRSAGSNNGWSGTL
ncbi:hypothetical protein IP87_17320 [beta proteobacterium AAP121]|nr:hypothetical protein IP80_19640 [beta proteobacterium AAP65]KPF95163.1 hypothetical protein IP87_17320 [beta proteobacterium AAP121]